MLRIPPDLLKTFVADGVSEEIIQSLEQIWHSDMPAHQKYSDLRSKAQALGATGQQIGNLNLALSMFAKQSPEDWAEIMPQVVHIHGKFYGFDDAGDQTSMDLARVLKVFVAGGFKGFLSSEWEGHAYTDAFSGFDMVEKHRTLCRKILNNSAR